MKRLVALLLLACATTVAAHPAPHGRDFPRPARHVTPTWPQERLPRTFTPSAYRARISVEDKLVGSIEIDGTMAAATEVFWLDFTGQVTAAHARRGTEVVALRVTVQKDRIALEPPDPLAGGMWTVAIDYTAKIADNGTVPLPADGAKRDPIPEQLAASNTVAAGPFRETVDGAAYTFTQSEPMDARAIFPCVDEPDRKVSWQLTLDVPAAEVAASNAPIVHETALPHGRKRVEFAPTQPLPSYLVAFVVGPFDVIDAGVAKSGTHLRILETRGHKAAWAASTAARVLDFLEAWTGIPYAYGKLDLVAVPRTGVHWAAMENPGLVTFADWVLRPDESRDQKRTWVAIAAHEFAHQWFGDLVTMAWWDDIWLNESFAVWMAREIVAELDPSYAEPAGTAYFDFVEIARPPPGKTNYQDYFAGGRGARALAMFAEVLGPVKFKAAIHAYLAAHAHGNATTADLAAALSASYGAPLEGPLVAALDTAAMPDVTIRRACPAIAITASAPTPVCIAYEQDGKRASSCVLVDRTASIPVASCPRWVVPNADGAMRYTTRRTPAELAATSFGWDLLSPPERAAVLDETGPDLALALRLVDAPSARTWAAETIARAARLAPVPIDAWLRAKYLARARKVRFDPADREDEMVLAAIAEAGDPVLERAAIALVLAGLHDVRTDVIGAVTRLALRGDPSLEATVLAELDRAFFERRRALLHTLSTIPGVLARAATLPMLTAGDRLVMLADTCDPARRAEAQELASSLSDGANPILRDFNACLDRRDRSIELWRRVK